MSSIDPNADETLDSHDQQHLQETAEQEEPDPTDGPFYSDYAHTPLGHAIVGIWVGVVSGVIVSLATLVATGQEWPSVIRVALVATTILWLMWVWVWRLTETGYRKIQLGTAVVVGLVVVATGALLVASWATDATVTTSFAITAGFALVAGPVIVVVTIRRVRRGYNPDDFDKSRSNLRAFAGVDAPGWVQDHTTLLHRLEDQLDELTSRQPIPVRAATLREWWRLRPSWKGPTK